jgi:hypothetical protein
MCQSMRHVQLKHTWGCALMRVLQWLGERGELPHKFRQETHWCTSQPIQSANNSLVCYLNYCTVASCTLLDKNVHLGHLLMVQRCENCTWPWTLWVTKVWALSYSQVMPAVSLSKHSFLILVCRFQRILHHWFVVIILLLADACDLHVFGQGMHLVDNSDDFVWC